MQRVADAIGIAIEVEKVTNYAKIGTCYRRLGWWSTGNSSSPAASHPMRRSPGCRSPRQDSAHGVHVRETAMNPSTSSLRPMHRAGPLRLCVRGAVGHRLGRRP
ncbi:hypothetical protein [Candidatus Roseilinea sp. NK_OTU-006]|uniref:hypothetical protein n=1 Tax=Candidatus Roseilinea sp. NK_OTU-006 TaxID=2704250 RepID=UPI002A5A4F07|nr:hypothetical protein [Candidatus Roseilinea sp. NK_OTU-006]